MTDNTINVNAVHDAWSERRRVNSIDIMEAVFVRDGKILKVTRAERESFRFTGLGNESFVVQNIPYKEG